jgi:hypothetical protein
MPESILLSVIDHFRQSIARVMPVNLFFNFFPAGRAGAVDLFSAFGHVH